MNSLPSLFYINFIFILSAFAVLCTFVVRLMRAADTANEIVM